MIELTTNTITAASKTGSHNEVISTIATSWGAQALSFSRVFADLKVLSIEGRATELGALLQLFSSVADSLSIERCQTSGWRFMKYTITSPANRPLIRPISPPTRNDRSIITHAHFGSVELISSRN